MAAHALESAFHAAWPPATWCDVTVVVAVSGGPDSAALLRAMVRLRPDDATGRIVVAHYNHGWRGAASNQDEAFVADLAASLGLPCAIGRSTRQPSSEESARDERYTFLLDTAHRWGARFVAVGHNAEDQAETILFRLLRGTGLSGLAGMPQIRQLSQATTLIRPLLSIRREQVLGYLQELAQTYQVDASNCDLKFARNRLRHAVLPAMQELSEGDVVDHFLQLGRQAAEIMSPIREDAQQLLDRVAEVRGDTVHLHFDRLNTLPNQPVLREMFVELWRRQHWPRGEMNSRRWEELAQAVLDQAAPAGMFPGGIRASFQGLVLRIQRTAQLSAKLSI